MSKKKPDRPGAKPRKSKASAVRPVAAESLAKKAAPPRKPALPARVRELERLLAEARASEASAALENARLSRELEARSADVASALERETATAEILRVISGAPEDSQPVLDTVAENAARICGASDAVVWRLVDQSLVRAATYGQIPVIDFGGQSVTPDSVSGRAVLERRPIHVDDLHNAPDFPQGARYARQTGHRTTLATPLLWEGVPIGAILIRRMEVRPFTEKQIELLKTFADQAAIAVQNAQMFKETQEALEQQTATAEVLEVISNSVADARPVFEKILESCRRVVQCTDLSLVTVDEHSMAHLSAVLGESGAQWKNARPLPVEATVIGEAVRERRVMHYPDALNGENVPEALRRVATKSGNCSCIVAPLIWQERAVGGLFVVRGMAARQWTTFTAKEVALLETFANQAVIAIQNARLFKELQARNQDLVSALDRQTATAEILRVISQAQADVQPVFEAIADSVMRLFGAWAAAAYQYDGECIRLVAARGGSPGSADALMEQNRAPRRPTADHPRDRSVLTGTMHHVVDVDTDPVWGPRFREQARMRGFRSGVTMPMLRGRDVVGVLTATKQQAGGFTPTEIALLQTFADQAVIAIENARLLNELQAKNADLTESLERQTATSEILRVISASPTDVQPVFETIIRNAVQLAGASIGALFRFDGGKLHCAATFNQDPESLEAVRRAYPMPPNRTQAAGRAVLDRTVIEIPNALEDPEYDQEMAARIAWRSILAVPMLRGDGSPIGVIIIQRIEGGRFAPAAVELLKTFADQGVIAIENARLLTELQVSNRDLTTALDQQTATSDILRVISRSQTDLQPVFDAIVGSAVRLLRGHSGGMSRVAGEQIVLAALTSFDEAAAAAVRTSFPQSLQSEMSHARAIRARAPINVADAHTDPRLPEAAGAAARLVGYRSAVVVPMLRHDEAIGAIRVNRREPGGFTDDEIALLQTFADQAVIAIENARLLTELQVSNRELTTALDQQTATSDILRVISRSQTDLQPVFDAILESAVRLLRADSGLLSRVAGEQIVLAAFTSVDEATDATLRTAFPQPLQSEVRHARVIRDRAPINVADVHTDPRLPEAERTRARARRYRSAAAVPMLRHGEAIGAIGVNRREAGGFTDDEIALLQTFADQAVIAIENVRLFTELQARTAELTHSVDELRALGEVSQAVSSSLELETVLATIVTRAVDLSASQAGIVYEFDEDSQTFQARATHGVRAEFVEAVRAAPIRLGEGVVGRAGVTREPVQIPNIESGSELVAPQVRGLVSREGVRSLLAVPVLREERILGNLVILRREQGSFSPEVVATLQTFAAQSVLAIQNARLFREIQRQKQYSDALVETSPVAIVTLDMGGTVAGWNPGAERLFGYTPAEAVGRTIDSLIAAPEVREEILANVRQMGQGRRVSMLTRRARKDGTLVDVEISSVPVVVHGAEVGVIAIYHDITELLRARQEAEAANEAKGAFLATMSHEIRTPMNAVIGMSGLLLNTALNDEQREYAEVIRGSGDALLSVINDILDFSKIEAGKLDLESQPFELRECVEGTLDLVASRAAEKGLDLAYLIGDGVPAAVVGDVTRLRQILLNLLSNAVKFTDRGEVMLSVTGHRLGDASTGYELAFSVRDTGIGIPTDRIGRLFQSFSQVDASTTRRYGGTGLGLAISQRLCELMGGHIGVTSEPGRGSEFRFTIRAPAAEGFAASTRRDLRGVQPLLEGRRILVVDDNATNRRILTTHLDSWGMRTRATESPLQALAWIQQGESFDLAILDMHMPEMDGVALARAFRQHPAGAALRLVLFTSLGRREAGRHDALADGEGFAAYLHKPIKPSQLFDTLVSLLVGDSGARPAPVERRVDASRGLDPTMASRHPLRILLAEDNVVNQKVALRLLGQMGYRADVAGNGREAIQAVERQEYDVVLMDVQMPEMDGLEASREIGRRWGSQRRPRIVAMTANAMQGDRELCVAAGMDDYVAKPIRVEELVAALERSPRRTDNRVRGATGAAGGAGAAGPLASPSSPVSADAGVVDSTDAVAPTDGVLSTAPITSTATVDRAVFEGLATTMGAEFAAELVDTFVEDGRDLVATLTSALAQRDLDAFRRAAHSLKSNAETLGATSLAGLARELENTARAGSLDGTASRVEQLRETYELVAREFKELRRGLPR